MASILKHTTRMILTIGDESRGIPVEFRYSVAKGTPAVHESGTGVPLEPATKDTIELHGMTINGVDSPHVLAAMPEELIVALEQEILGE